LAREKLESSINHHSKERESKLTRRANEVKSLIGKEQNMA
jgi:hypothetical protein